MTDTWSSTQHEQLRCTSCQRGGGGEGESAFRGDTQFCVEKFDLSENEKETA